LQWKERVIYSSKVPGQCPLIALEDIEQNQCRSLGGEKGSEGTWTVGSIEQEIIRLSGSLYCMESGNIINFEHISVVAIGRESWEIYIRSFQYKVEFECQISIW
jgi:hypothetical protein